MKKYNIEKLRKSELLSIKTNGNKACDKIKQSVLRVHCISVILNDKKLIKLNYLRGHYAKGEWLRMASLQKHPMIVPPVNIDTWKTLGENNQKLNHIALHIDIKSKDSHLTHTVGINAVVARNLGATDDEIISSVSRMLGFRATSSVLRKTISEVIEGLLNEGILRRENTMIIVSETVEN